MIEARSTKHRDGSERILLGNVIMKEKPARKRADRIEWRFSLEMLRLREIEAVIRHRHGNGIPDPEGSDDVETCHAYLRAVAMTPGVQDVVSWAAVWAPWASGSDLSAITAGGSKRKRMLGADAVARLLFVTLRERSALGLKTVGACDLPPEERQQKAKDGKRSRDRARQEQKRRADGRLPRQSYEASSTSQLKPWEAEGVSRRTWYRRRGTGPSRVEVIRIGDTPVSRPNIPRPKPSMVVGQSCAAGLVAGLGDHPPAELQEAAPHGSGDTGRERAA